jgi:hypothetical protein
MPATGFRTLPERIQNKLKQIDSQLIEVGCITRLPKAAIGAGDFRHLGMSLDGDDVTFLTAVIPMANRGPFSNRNANGYEVVRKDLPKETHYNYIESPNWGDWSRGSHTVALPYEKYPRDFYAPRLSELHIERINTNPDAASFTFRFKTSDVLDRQNEFFGDQLLEVINFLRENVGCYGIQAHDAPLSDYLRELRVSWELLPPGSRDDVFAFIFRGRTSTPEEEKIVEDRYDFLMSLEPQKLIVGTSGMERYFGALVADNRVLFENLRYGNAAYVMYERWEELSQRSRTELMSGRYGHSVVRVVHTPGWQDEVKQALVRPPTEAPPRVPRRYGQPRRFRRPRFR